MSDLAKWRGTVALLCDAVEHGSRAVERIQVETARRPFGIIEHIPGVAAPTRIVHEVYDTSVGAVHRIIRGVTAVVGATADFTLEQVEKRGR